MIDFIIEKLTELLIKQNYADKKNGIAYIKKVDAYRDLINFFKQIKNEKKEGTCKNEKILEKEN